MIVYLKNLEIDREHWDSCIKGSNYLKPFAYSWYLDIMSPGWEALIDDDYDSVFPLPVINRFGYKKIVTPPFLQQLGAFSPDKNDSDVIREFIDFLPYFFRYIDLNVKQKVDYEGFKLTELSGYSLDLSYPYEKIFEDFSRQCKKQIELFDRKSIELVTDISPDEILDLYISNKPDEDVKIRLLYYHRIKSLMNFCLKNKKGRILGVRTARRRLISAMFIIEVPGYKTIQLIADSHEGSTKHTGFFIVNELIRNASFSRLTIDFAEPSIISIPSYAKAFGCMYTPHYRIYRNRIFWPIRFLR